jgi:hypothetical protein
VAKHIIYLKEGSDAILLTVENMLAHHKYLLEMAGPSSTEAMEATQFRLKYKQGLFHSVNLRLRSLEKRMQNIINLVGSPKGNCEKYAVADISLSSPLIS